MIYFDNASTTKPCEEAVNAVICALSEFGNPSSLHGLGVRAEKLVSQARKNIAIALGGDEDCVFFTSGATESNNTAILGSASTLGKRKKRVVTTTVEHPSVASAFDALEKQGFEVVRVAPNENGTITAEQLVNATNENTCLVSCMLVNNENGYILPVNSAFTEIKRKFPQTILHCDAVQAFMKIPFSVKTLGADLVSVSGHKVFAPKGVGALYIKKGVRIAPLMLGGGQEKGFRSGTESVPLICGFGEAVKTLAPTVSARLERCETLKAYLCASLAELSGVTVNSGSDCSPYVISVTVDKLKSETLLHYLESREIYVSSGSACSKGKKSSVLKAFRLPEKALDSTIRISITADATEQELDALITEIANAQGSLCKLK